MVAARPSRPGLPTTSTMKRTRIRPERTGERVL
jgi:hypothetical protein